MSVSGRGLSRRFVLAAGPAALLAGCTAGPRVWASDERLRAASYRHPGGPGLTLFTMKSTDTDTGNHTGLMISASQRVIFDPAGTFGHSSIPERHDLHYGITPRVEEFYISYHARETYYVLRQDIPVSAETAETVFARARVAGPVPKAQCTTSTSGLLKGLPELGTIRSTWFPDSLADQVAAIPGVRTQEFRENDSDDKGLAQAAFEARVGG